MQNTTSGITELFNKKFTLMNFSFAFLSLFVLFIPISKPVSTVGEVGAIALLLLALVTSSFKEQIQANIKNNKAVFSLSFFYLFYLVGLIYSQDLQQSLSELNKKHYFLTLPFILACFKWDKKMIHQILAAFVIANVFVALLILVMEFGEIYIFRAIEGDISPFVQRPRASLFIATGILFIPDLIKYNADISKKSLTILLYASLLLLILALFLFKGRVGLLSFVVLMPVVLLYYKQKGLLLVFGLITIAAVWISIKQGKLVEPIKEAISEVKDWQHGYLEGDPEQSSMGRRLDYYEVFFKVFERNPVVGVGSGDLMLEALPVFEEMQVVVRPDRPHNQFLDIAVRFGFIGLFFFLLLFYRIYHKVGLEFKVLGHIIIWMVLLSMLFDDTLETQAGISFAVLFTGIFLLKVAGKREPSLH